VGPGAEPLLGVKRLAPEAESVLYTFVEKEDRNLRI